MNDLTLFWIIQERAMVFHNLKFFKPAGILCIAVLLILIIATSDHYKDTENYLELKEAGDEFQFTNEVPKHESGIIIVIRTLIYDKCT